MIRLLVAALLAALLALPVGAQEMGGNLPASEAAAMAGWPVVLQRAEEALAADVAPETLDALRAELVEWRRRFEAAQAESSSRIETLRAQIAALGALPAEGDPAEPAAVTAQRAELEARLDPLLVPIRAAETRFAEADALISEADSRIEARRAELLLAKSPTPLNPVHWLPALAALGGWIVLLGRELLVPFATPAARSAWQGQGVELGALVFAAILLLWRSGVWLGRLRDRIAGAEAESAVARVVLLGISLARLILPVAGLVLVTRVVRIMGADGLRAETAATLLPAMGIVVLSARWLALQALPRREMAASFLPTAPARRGTARRYVLLLGLLAAAEVATKTIAATAPAVAASQFVAQFLILVPAGAVMFRLGAIFVAEGRAARSEDADGLWAQILRVLGRALGIVGVAAPVIAALGYVNLGTALLWQSALTFALIALIGILQGFVFDAYAAVTRRADAGRDALTPTLVGFALAVGALPALALIWGVRLSTLGEWWGTFLRGFDLGGTRVSPSNFLTFAIVFVLGYTLVRLVRGVLRTSVLPKTNLDTGGTNAILSGTSYVGVVLAALIAITAAGIDLSGLAIVAGALSVGIGFGLQTIVQNFVSGIILLIERPIKLGDWINVGGIEGFVRQISVRSTRIETFDRQDVIVPNADLITGVVTNYTLNNSAGRVVLTVGVAYGSDTRAVQRILEEVAQTHPRVILNPAPLITFDGFGADSLNFTVRVVLRDILFKLVVTSELNHAIAERFKAEGLEIPFAQRDLWLRNPEALHPVREAS